MTYNLPSDVVRPFPGTSAGALVFRPLGRLHVAVIVKATFAFAQGAPMPRVEAQPVLRADVPDETGAGSLRFSSDLAPYLSDADVLLTGHAYPAPGGSAHPCRVRLAILDGDNVLLDKTLHVEAPAGAAPVPLLYELAYGGPGVTENPVGTGAVPRSAAPRILDPQRPSCPAGFGPIPRSWPARAALRKTTPPNVIDVEVPEIPEGFDWSYFQAAPLDQRIGHLRGDEWIVLEGLHAALPCMRMRLPGARAHARVHGLGTFGIEEGRSIDLVADTLRIDGDEERCTVVWRGVFPVPATAALAAMWITCGVDVQDASGAGAPTMLLSDLAPSGASITDGSVEGGTVLLGGATEPAVPRTEGPAAPPSTVLLDAAAATVLLDPAPPGAVLFGPTAPGTVTLGESESPSRSPALPFKPAPDVWSFAGVAASPPRPISAPFSTGTVRLSEQDQADAAVKPPVPFLVPPGWPAPEVAPEPPSAAPPAKPGAEAARRDPWRPVAESPPPAPRPRPPPPGPPRAPPELKASIYGTFKKGP